MNKPSFFTKRIFDTTSSGSLLIQRRIELGKTLDEASAVLNIGKQYLKALEDGAYESIPGFLYVKRFLKAYAEWLGVPGAYALFHSKLPAKPQLDRALPRNVAMKELMIFPRLLRYGAGAVSCLLLVGYLLFQVYVFLVPPAISLSVYAPLTHQKQLTVRGYATNTLTLSVNGEEVPVVNGSFEAAVALVPGLNSVVVKAVNRVAKESQATLSLYYAKAKSERASQVSLR